MTTELKKVLLVACIEDSREATFSIIDALKEHQYGADISRIQFDCNDNPDEKSDIVPDIYLTKTMPITSYRGVIFLDDGGDFEASKALAKEAIKNELAVGGFGHGILVLKESGLLKDHNVCSGLPKEFYKDIKAIIKSPIVRCDDIVTGIDNPIGFANLMAGAMGGRKKKIVEASSYVEMNKEHVAVVEAEAAAQQIWFQNDDRVAFREDGVVRIMSVDDYCKKMKFRISSMLKILNFIKPGDVSVFDFIREIVRNVIKLKLVKELQWIYSNIGNRKNIKVALMEDRMPVGTNGHWINEVLKLDDRVWDFRRNKDGLDEPEDPDVDWGTIRRYMQPDEDSDSAICDGIKWSFYAENREPRRWDEIEAGENNYPSRIPENKN